MIKVYLAGEIHTNWREDLIQLCNSANLKTQFFSPVTNHENSDNCGVEILGPEDKNFWKDNKGANINSIRTKKAIKDSDPNDPEIAKNTKAFSFMQKMRLFGAFYWLGKQTLEVPSVAKINEKIKIKMKNENEK